MKAHEEGFARLRRGTTDCVTEGELRAKLERARREGRPLRVKYGWDPTAPEVHLGHCVVLRKLRQFQDLGHTAVLVVGDATGFVGDPSGRTKTRPQLDEAEIERNLERYAEQAGKVVDLSRAEIVRNGDWFRKMRFHEVIRFLARGTVARMIERDFFQERMKRGEAVGLHELSYPLLQGWDSVQVRADVELGATEQLFNLLVGRDLQEREGQERQVCLTTPILEGTDGRKMSKTYGNFVAVLDPPREMYGKIMSIPDRLLRPYFELLTDLPDAEIESLLDTPRNPIDAKVRLAKELVAGFHSAEAAEREARWFDRVIREGAAPTEVAEVEVSVGEEGDAEIVALLLASGLVSGSSDARRLIAQKAVTVDGRRIPDHATKVRLSPEGVLLRVGKRRFARLRPRARR